MTQTALYRHFDADGVLLYVGISLAPIRRLSQHAESDWSDAIRRVDIEMHPTRVAAIEAERHAIRTERPAKNRIRFGADVVAVAPSFRGPDAIGPLKFDNTEAAIFFIGPEEIRGSFGVTQKRIDQCRRDNAFPAAWYDELERLTGRPLPRSLFSFKRRAAGE